MPDGEPPAVELAIDSASVDASVAVLRGERVIAERNWRVETTYSRELLAGIDAALRDAGVERTALSAVTVDVGPGGYSGLRTGVATAQGLALALGVPLAGVSRLEAQAFRHLAGNRAVVAVHDLGRGRVAWAAFAAGERAPVTLLTPRVDGVEQCARGAPRGALWCGEVTAELREARTAAGRGSDEGDADVVPEENARRASDLARLARLHEAYRDPAAVDVVYLRPPPITKPRDRTR